MRGIVLANASVESVKTRFAVEAHLASLFGADACEGPADPVEMEDAAPPAPDELRVALPEPLREVLTAANESRHDWIAREGRPDRTIIRSGYHRVADYKVSTTDPDATLAPVAGAGTHPSYHAHYVVDGGKRRIILQVLVTPTEVMENQPALDLIFRTRFRWKLWPSLATGDTTYGTAENIVALEHEGIRAYVPLSPYDQRSPYFNLSAFRYDAARDVYICPNNALLRLYTKAESGNAKRYNARAKTCNACPLKAQCTPGKNGRSLTPNSAEEWFERVRGYHETEAYQKAMRKRQVWVEPLFAEAKDWHGMRRFRLRQLWRVNCEALLIAAGQNLKRLLNKRGWGRRPLPSGAAIQLVFIYWVLGVWRAQRSLTAIQDSTLSAASGHRLTSYQ